jgi:HK97 family phage major capsid protein
MIDLELKAALDALQGENKTIFTDLKGKYDALQTEHKNMQTQLDVIDKRAAVHHAMGGGPLNATKAFTDTLKQHMESFETHGRVRFEVPTLLPEGKSTITSAGITSTEPAAGVQGAGRFPYRLRTLFRTVPTSLPTIGVLRSVTESLNASPQVETYPKSESAMTFELVQVPVQTIAHFVNYSRQAMDDLDGFQEWMDATLTWALERKAELEIISGDGTGVHLTGLATDATAFDNTILSGAVGWNLIDCLGAADCQLEEAGFNPDFAVVSPREWFKMVSLKNSFGGYVLNTPQTSVGERVYDLQIIPSPQMSGSSFLVGDSSKAVIRMRMETIVELSRQHNVNFTSNLVTALAEQRFGLEVLRPDAFVSGSLASSPA